MKNTLINEELIVSVNSLGAELTGIRSLSTGIEYLWQANPGIWARHAPVLFPIVGRMEGSYFTDGKEYTLAQHGFARDMEFELIHEAENRLVYRLKSNPQTLVMYPYRFELQIAYEINFNEIGIKYTVTNTDKGTIWFSIGAHPGFNCPLTVGETFSDYYLEFEQAETISNHLLTNGLLNGETAPLLDGETRLPLTTELFKNDALVLKGLKSRSVTLKSRKSKYKVKMKMDGFPFFGIWTKPGTASFICLEPWMGVADTLGKKAGLTGKEGIISLDKGKHFECGYSLEVE